MCENISIRLLLTSQTFFVWKTMAENLPPSDTGTVFRFASRRRGRRIYVRLPPTQASYLCLPPSYRGAVFISAPPRGKALTGCGSRRRTGGSTGQVHCGLRTTTTQHQLTCKDGSTGQVHCGLRTTTRQHQLTCNDGSMGNVHCGLRTTTRQDQLTRKDGSTGQVNYGLRTTTTQHQC